MEDDDIAVVTGGMLSIHRVNRQAGEDPVRAIQTLQMELQQIMKGQNVAQKTVLLSDIRIIRYEDMSHCHTFYFNLFK